MSFELAIRLTECLLAFAFILQSFEYLSVSSKDKLLHITRCILSIGLLFGVYTPFICIALLVNMVFLLYRYQGPYNGGSDRMGILILCALCCIHILPSQSMKELAFGYLALQVVLSYFISGWVKVINKDWRTGRALQDVFLFSAYPVNESLRKLSEKKNLLMLASWSVIIFELAFPLSFIHLNLLYSALIIGAIFHCANAFLFGFNRFFWVWLSAYPSLLWFQDRFSDVLEIPILF